MSATRNRKSLKRARDSVLTKGEGHKIIIGIDYGTTFSGVSYVTTDKAEVEDITIMSSWPGDPHVSWKTLTRIAYSQENPKLNNNKWGFEVSSKVISYSWTKLLLDKNAAARKHDDPSLASMTGAGMLKLPPFRDAAGVCEDFLHEVYKHVSGKLRQQMTDLTFENTPMECWVTLPAVWSEEAKDATLKAAKNARFGQRPGDEIFTIAEPEAAAIATLKEFAKSDAMNPITCNENILICDCGGGTVDITTYKIDQVHPYLIFDELCVGIGKFKVELGPINLDVPESKYYDEEDRLVLLKYEDMQALFDPVVAEITTLVAQQVKAAKDIQNSKINRIILVGGFGESPYLNKKLKAWCRINGNITLICPLNPQSAVVRGAALRGLQGIAPRVKHLRRHYGSGRSMAFREGIDPEETSTIDPWGDRKMCSGRIEWLIAKGEDIVKDTSRINTVCRKYTPGKHAVFKDCLLACVSEEPPEYRSDCRVELVGTIEVTLDKNLDLSQHTEQIYNDRLKSWVYQVSYQQQIIFGTKGDNLTFRCLVGGKEIGKSVMKFDR